MIWIFISGVWCILGLGSYWLLRHRYAALIDLKPETDPLLHPPTLAVIIPARNETVNIAGCLDGMLAQSYPTDHLQLLVVDDASSDDTRSIAQSYEQEHRHIQVLDAGALPPGWLGKPHACWVAAQNTRAEWLCFVDADTRHAPELLVSAVAVAIRGNVDLLSLHPRQQMLGFWERLLMPLPFMTLMNMMDAQRINDPASSLAMANGQFILIQRAVYDALDGHLAIRNQVMDDIAIARLVKGAGYNLKLFGGGNLIQTRMYNNLQSIWQGLARGASDIFGVPLTSLAILASLLATFFPMAYPGWRLYLALQTGGGDLSASAILALLGSFFWYGTHALALQTYQVPFGYLLLIPFSNLLVAIVNIDGLLRRAMGQRLWKGRRI